MKTKSVISAKPLNYLISVLCLLMLCFVPVKDIHPVTLKNNRAQLKQDRPNIIFIMSDDHCARAIGAYGSRLASLDPTPNIDKLAEEGMLFTNVFCTNSICTPSRATPEGLARKFRLLLRYTGSGQLL